MDHLEQKICMRCIVSGRVQGVFFRAWTQAQAQALGLSGYAKNLADGRVEVLCCGEQDTVTKLCQALWQGPVAAKVNDVTQEMLQYQSIQGFEVG